MPSLPDDLQFTLVDNIDAVWDMKRYLLSEQRPADDTILGFDTETTGLRTFADDFKIRMIQVGDSKRGFAVPSDLWGGAALEILDNWQGTYTAHNLAYDSKVMKKTLNYDIPWHRFDDTLIMAQIARPGAPAGLKDLTSKHVDPRAADGEKELKKAFKDNGWDWSTVPLDLLSYWLYSALDPVLAVYLNRHFSFVKDKYPQVYDLEMAVRRIYTEVEYTGMTVDLKYVREKKLELTEKIDTAKEWAQDNWGINISSGPQLAEFFEKGLGAEFSVRTDGGAPSTGKEQMDIFAEHGGMVGQVSDFVLGVRKAGKLVNSYFKNFIDEATDIDTEKDTGVLHCNFKTLGARTGRSSVTKPALQTLPSNESLIRKSFIASPGNVLVSCDYEQVEMRLLAIFSDDDNLKKAFKEADEEGGDFFTNLGKIIYHDEEFSKNDPRRKNVKSSMYGLAYGASPSVIAKQAGVPVEDMEQTVRDIHEAFPGIQRFMDKIQSDGDAQLSRGEEPHIYTSTGRRLHADKGKVYALLNYTLQGTAGEQMKVAVTKLDAAGMTPYLRMVIHDECIFEIPENRVEEFFPIIKEAMSFVNGEFSVDLPADPELIGQNWGIKYEKQ